MSNDLERQLQERLHALDLPPAPAPLLAEVKRLRAIEPAAPQERSPVRWRLLLVAALAVVGLTATSFALVGSSGPSPRPAVPTTAPSSAVSPAPTPAGLTFAAPGISFDLPTGWTDQSTAYAGLDSPIQRYVGLLARGMVICPMPGASPGRTPRLTGCGTEPSQPGSAWLEVVEFPHPLPFDTQPGTRITLGANPAWETVQSSRTLWEVQSPDGGLYVLVLTAPEDELAQQASTVRAALSTLRLSAWEQPPVAVNGLIHEDPWAGFSFDYPAGWVRYYPNDISMVDSAVVTIASRPVLPPCDGCQRFTMPDDAIVIEFREGNGPVAPDWTKAPATVGGQPAFRWDYGPSSTPGNPVSITESHHWEIRLPPGPAQLGIYVSMSGSDSEPLRAAMDQVLASVRITPRPSASP